MNRVANKVALITGAASGVGRADALLLAAEGARVVLTDVNEDAGRALACEIGDTALFVRHDIADDDGWRHAIAATLDRFGRLDVLVNNAGYGQAGALTASDLATQVGMIDLNVRALVELTHLVWDGMLARRRGGVLNVASTAAFQPGPLMAVYYASKAFVLSFSEALWEEARATGVKVSCLCPGPTVSRFRERAGTDKTRLSTASVSMPSLAVAELGYRGFQANQRVVVPGARNRMGRALARLLPTGMVLRVVRYLQSPP